VAAAERVGSRESDNRLVVKTHAIKHVAQVLGSLKRVGKAAGHGARRAVRRVGTAQLVVNVRAAGDLDGDRAGQRPDVGVAVRRVGLLDCLEGVALDVQACVGTLVLLRSEAHRGAVGAAGVVLLGVGARRVPRKAHGKRARIAVLVDQHLADVLLDRVHTGGVYHHVSEPRPAHERGPAAHPAGQRADEAERESQRINHR